MRERERERERNGQWEESRWLGHKFKKMAIILIFISLVMTAYYVIVNITSLLTAYRPRAALQLAPF